MWGLAAESVKVMLGAHSVAVAGSVRTDSNKRARYIMLRISVASLQAAAQSSEGDKSSTDLDATAVSESTLAAAAAVEDYGSAEAAAWLVSLTRMHIPLVMDVAVAGNENVRVGFSECLLLDADLPCCSMAFTTMPWQGRVAL